MACVRRSAQCLSLSRSQQLGEQPGLRLAGWRVGGQEKEEGLAKACPLQEEPGERRKPGSAPSQWGCGCENLTLSHSRESGEALPCSFSFPQDLRRADSTCSCASGPRGWGPLGLWRYIYIHIYIYFFNLQALWAPILYKCPAQQLSWAPEWKWTRYQ